MYNNIRNNLIKMLFVHSYVRSILLFIEHMYLSIKYNISLLFFDVWQ